MLQAFALGTYFLLVVWFLTSAEKWFGNRPDEFWAPLLFMSLFSFSALICGLIVFFFPFRFMFIEKTPKKAIEVVVFTAIFLFLLILGLVVAVI